MQAGVRQNLPLVLVAATYWGLALLDPWDLFGGAAEALEFTQKMAWLAFVLIHGVRRYGWDNLFVFFGITFLISWTIEAASIAASFPFGNYHYTELLGFKIGAVPLTIMPAYFVSGYLAWTMATIFVGDLGTGMNKRNLFLVPFVASFILVMWNFCFDPIRSTIEGAWIWEGGGPYHGVPISNYGGWYLTAFLIFQVFALYLYRFSRNARFVQRRIYWYLVPTMYLGVALEFLLAPFFQTTNLDIYWSLFLGAVLTMVFVSLLCMIVVKRMNEGFFSTRSPADTL